MSCLRPLICGCSGVVIRGWIIALLILCGMAVGGCEPDDGAGPDRPTITFWTMEGYQPEQVEILRRLGDRFEREHGVKVQIEFFIWDNINSKYLAALAAGKPPNIGQHGPDLALRFGDDGLILPVDELIAEIGHDRFYPEFLDDVCLYRGHYWSVPWFVEVRPLLVRTDWLAELGLEPPTTWAEWLNVCKAMTRDSDGDGEIDRWGFGLYGNDQFGHAWIALAAQNGGGLFAPDGAIAVDAPANVEALRWYCDLYRRHQVTPPGTKSATWVDTNAYFKRGMVGTLVTNGYILNELRREAPQILPHAKFVPMPAPEPGGAVHSYLGGSHLMVFKDAPHADEAKAFIRFLMRDANYLAFLQCTSGGTLPVLEDIGRDPYFQQDDNLRMLISQIPNGVRHGFRGPPNPAVGAVEGEHIFGELVRAVLNGEKTAAEALHDARIRTERSFVRQGVEDRD